MENTAETGGGGPVSLRWNPTKEQISILENLYKEGVRTPSAEQIQQITSRLKGYGHIEGKNVFYWFQNHKARKRQKQKQKQYTTLAYVNHFLHFNSFPPFAPQFPSPNVVCSPYYVHLNDVGFYPQYHNNSKVIQSCGAAKRSSKSKGRICNNNGGFGYEPDEHEDSTINASFQTETLSLFPTHPTGDLHVGSPPQTTVSAPESAGNSARDCPGGCRTDFEFFL